MRIKMKFYFVLALTAGSALFAQQQPQQPPVQPQLPGAMLAEPVYVRRFSAGVTLSVLGLSPMRKNDMYTSTENPTVNAMYTTQGVTRRVGFGLTFQGVVTERVAVNAGVFLHPGIGYRMSSQTLEGVDNPNTTADERTFTSRNEDTRFRYYDFPVTLRYYGKDRHDPGARWFVEAGGALRRVSRIKTTINETINDGDTTCCVTTPATPARRTIRGVVAGFGVQVIDPVGLRLGPQIRYTRWGADTFSSNSTVTQRNQIEAMVSLTF
jgi:hypothetical protein